VRLASTVLEQSINQPTLPHAILVINSGASSVVRGVGSVSEQVFKWLNTSEGWDAEFFRLKRTWEGRGKIIRTLQDLVWCYYSTIKVVEIPAKKCPELYQQVTHLYDTIADSCNQTYHEKRQTRMLLDSESLATYVGSALDHFAQSPAAPFDFVQASVQNTPASLDIAGHLLHFTIELRARLPLYSGQKILEKLSEMAALCFKLDCIRNHSMKLALPGVYIANLRLRSFWLFRTGFPIL
jgi:hypothetical protein